MKRLRLSYERRRALTGFLFLLPFIIGALTFFLRPFIGTVVYSLSKIEYGDSGTTVDFLGFKNYTDAFVSNSEFLPAFLDSLGNVLYEVPFILVFSLALAVVLCGEFKGRTFFRAAFFLPLIISTGPAAAAAQGSASGLYSADNSIMMFEAVSIEPLLMSFGLGENFVSTIVGIINNIFNLTLKSGVQILIFIAGIKAIPTYLYEVTQIEGANRWETFWLVTFRMISPMLLINIVYTVIDSFSDVNNPAMKFINTMTQNLKIEIGSAAATVYFISILLLLLMVIGLWNRFLSDDAV